MSFSRLVRRVTGLNDRILFKMLRVVAVTGIVTGICYSYITTNVFLISLILFAIYLATGGWRFARVVHKTLGRDLFALSCLVRFKFRMRANIRNNRTLPVIFQNIAAKYPNKIALRWENVNWTFSELEGYSNAIANYFHEKGLKRGDTVAIFAMSRPEYVALWLGLSKIGVASALINFNLRHQALAHCINIVTPSAVIVDGCLIEHVNAIRNDLTGRKKFFTVCDNFEKFPQMEESSSSLDDILRNGSRHPPPRPKDATYFDKVLYIYTSGTTGLPKAAVITHNRFYYMCTMPHLILQYRKDDVLYCALPLYHSNGGIVGIGQCLCNGLTFSFRSKFSASNFWTDCMKFNATVILYIGEICRYLLAQPHRATDTQHQVRMVSGNGLRGEIWQEFISRFNIAKVGEFYGATEGNASLINIDNRLGACGFVSVIAPFAYPVRLMKVDEDSELVRGPDGLCIVCSPGEQGMLVGKIIKGNATQSFDGYADHKASQKKVVYDVMQKGDSYFMSGDILCMDEWGYMYFRDRTGDTFRWKGENVSTAECEARIAKIFDKKLTVAVYGVTIPLSDGKAGMAAIADPERTIDFDGLYNQIQLELPSYARPLFIRQTNQLELTSTHKLKKVALGKEGYNIHTISDPMYFLDSAAKKYVVLDVNLYNKIMDGTVRV